MQKKKVQRIVETTKHIYKMEYTPGFLTQGREAPNDIVILAVDGKTVESEEDEVSIIQSIEPDEFEQINDILTQYESD